LLPAQLFKIHQTYSIFLAMKSLFTVQYSHALDKFFLTEKENPEQGAPFDIPIIDSENNSIIELGAFMVDKEQIECSKPSKIVFANPNNKPVVSLGYGYLYNFYAVSQPNFAPEGWHVPTREEWENFNGGEISNSELGGHLKETGTEHWQAPNTGAIDSFGFKALPGGYRYTHGEFYYFGTSARFWSNSLYSSAIGVSFYLSHDNTRLSRQYRDADCGLSVRLVKNNSVNPGSLIDVDGNEYPTINVGGQIWTAKNWKCTKLNDGTPIEKVTNSFTWGSILIPAYCAYNNDENLV
jgi:uncharacterized protein (TIGR02145 family)